MGQKEKKMKKAFTLAEVLITLGIIGVVAAITIPSLITKYHRHIAETKLKRFYSTMNQAIKMSIDEHNELLISNEITEAVRSYGPGQHVKIAEYYNEYFTKYINMATIIPWSKKSSLNSIFVHLPDGSGFKLRNYYGKLDIFYYLDVNLAESKKCSLSSGKADFYYGNCEKGNKFWFIYAPEKEMMMPYGYNNQQYALSQGKNGCYSAMGVSHYCTYIIMANGWKIPKDYPWIK